MTVVDAAFAPLFVWVVLGTEVVTGKVGAGAGGAVNLLGTGLEVSKRPAGTLDAVCTIEVVLNASFPTYPRYRVRSMKEVFQRPLVCSLPSF